ncbi:hypothetical protein EVAR_50952_1 [Eumeta japonica]|uniref:Uncharacterized protein n=1 Tax=Eumeta variegata TaxID=151549 RepID=A0A4C1X9V0_EUMVA|nr:hypothetical protein EVAR_50952_1 [Eumeta japonica]
MGLRRLITEFLWPPSSSIIRPWLPYSIKVLVKRNQTSPNSMGLRRLITEFLWPPSSSIIRPWLPYSIKVLVKESNEPKLDGVASFNYGVPMATFQLHHQTLITIEYQSIFYCIIPVFVRPFCTLSHNYSREPPADRWRGRCCYLIIGVLRAPPGEPPTSLAQFSPDTTPTNIAVVQDKPDGWCGDETGVATLAMATGRHAIVGLNINAVSFYPHAARNPYSEAIVEEIQGAGLRGGSWCRRYI